MMPMQAIEGVVIVWGQVVYRVNCKESCDSSFIHNSLLSRLKFPLLLSKTSIPFNIYIH